MSGTHLYNPLIVYQSNRLPSSLITASLVKVLRLGVGQLCIYHEGNNITALHFNCSKEDAEVAFTGLMPFLQRIPTIRENEDINAHYGRRLLAMVDYVNFDDRDKKITKFNIFIRLEHTRTAIATAKHYEAYRRKKNPSTDNDPEFDAYIEQLLLLLEECCDTPSLLKGLPLLTQALPTMLSEQEVKSAESADIYGSIMLQNLKLSLAFAIPTVILCIVALSTSGTPMIVCAIFMAMSTCIATLFFMSAWHNNIRRMGFLNENNVSFEQKETCIAGIASNSPNVNTLNLVKICYNEYKNKNNVSLKEFFKQLNKLSRHVTSLHLQIPTKDENEERIDYTP